MLYELHELCEIKYGKNQKKVENPNGEYPIYGTGGLMGFADQFLYNKPSVLIPRKGSISKVSFSDKPFWTVDTLFYTIVNEDIVLPKFLYYVLSRIDLLKYNEGTTIPSLRTETLNRLRLDIPEKNIQTEIVKILESIEAKLVNNEKLISKLGIFSNTLFKQWFIDFEFPNEQGLPYQSNGGKMVESELGMIPEGWKVQTLNEFATKITSGGTPSRQNDDFWEDGIIPWIKTKEIDNNYLITSEEFITEQGLKKSAAKLVSRNSVLLAMYGATAGKLAMLKFEASTNQACCAIETTNYLFLYTYLLKLQKSIEGLATGSAQQNLSKKIIENIKIVVPDDDILSSYRNLMHPSSDLIENLYRENGNLVKLRDTVLPKLLSGEIELPIKETMEN